MVLLDTSALLFWTLARTSLSQPAQDAISNSNRLLISSISFWEIGIKQQKGKLALPGTLREYLDLIQRVDRTEIIAVDERIWLQSIELTWNHRDPADRAIVATATILNCPLITSDRTIQDFYPHTIW